MMTTSKIQNQILACLQEDGRSSYDHLQVMLQLGDTELVEALVRLELDGLVKRHLGREFSAGAGK